MVTNRQVRRLMEILGKGKSLAASATKADMDEKTARKYRKRQWGHILNIKYS